MFIARIRFVQWLCFSPLACLAFHARWQEFEFSVSRVACTLPHDAMAEDMMATQQNGKGSRVIFLYQRRSDMKSHCIHSLLLLWCLVFVHLTQSNAENKCGSVTTESVDHRLDGMEAAAEAALAERTASATKYKELVSEINELIQEAKRMQEVEQELVRRTYAVENLVKRANAIQLKYLASELNLTIEQELEERRKLNRENAGGEQVDTSNAVTLQQLEQQTQLIPMMEDSETQLEDWILQVMEEEISLHHAKVAEMCSSGKCVTPIEAAQLVQASLTTFANDGVNMVDHAQGAKIVYELTSDTYIPPTDESDERLGTIWWRRYIPQDWERVLPSQWEGWKASIPSFLRHSFVSSDLLACSNLFACSYNVVAYLCFTIKCALGTKFRRNCSARSNLDFKYIARFVLGNEWKQGTSNDSTAVPCSCKGGYSRSYFCFTRKCPECPKNYANHWLSSVQ